MSASSSTIYPGGQRRSIRRHSRPSNLILNTAHQRAGLNAFQANYSLSPEYNSAWDDRFATEDRLRHEAAIRAEVERAVLAQKRAKAKKAAQVAAVLAYGSPADIAAEPLLAERRAPAPMRRMPLKASPGRPRIIDPINTFQFPRDTRPRDENIIVMERSPPQTPSKRLSPLARFNPFARTRADSMSSIIDDHSTAGGYSSDDEPSDAESWSKKLKRASTVENLFAMINHKAAKVRVPASWLE
ncbi:hypothetical protein DXG03_008097 [Asterophora parasitica]|uniref:Uncharacterized protein n=1 Tax=Asterophora parasitica TaxID=117018 RepID=A0A9P7G682_9AGAR|nr:hypothetical protein DXG03_008097 [Asterophora parasitica]